MFNNTKSYLILNVLAYFEILGSGFWMLKTDWNPHNASGFWHNPDFERPDFGFPLHLLWFGSFQLCSHPNHLFFFHLVYPIFQIKVEDWIWLKTITKKSILLKLILAQFQNLKTALCKCQILSHQGINKEISTRLHGFLWPDA